MYIIQTMQIPRTAIIAVTSCNLLMTDFRIVITLLAPSPGKPVSQLVMPTSFFPHTNNRMT